VDFFLDPTRKNCGLAVLAFVGMLDWWRGDGSFVVVLVVFLTGLFVLCSIVVPKVTGKTWM
jgi:hypothetical protein